MFLYTSHASFLLTLRGFSLVIEILLQSIGRIKRNAISHTKKKQNLRTSCLSSYASCIVEHSDDLEVGIAVEDNSSQQRQMKCHEA